MTLHHTIRLAGLALSLMSTVDALAQPEVLTVEPTHHVRPWAMWQDSTGFLWLDYGIGLAERYDGVSSVAYTELWPELTHLATGGLRQSAVDREGTIWLGFDMSIARTSGFYGQVQDLSHKFGDSAPISVYAILVDTNGEVWFGTIQGLARFDRDTETFIHYRHDPSDPSSLSHNYVYDVVQDREGKIWVGTEDGISRLDNPVEGAFTAFPLKSDDPTLSGSAIVDMVVDRSGDIWVIAVAGPQLSPTIMRRSASEGRLLRLDKQTKSFQEFDPGPKIYVNSFVQDRFGRYWAGTSNGLRRLEASTGRFIPQTVQSKQGQVLEAGPTSVLLDQSDVLWLSARFGVARADLWRLESVFETYGYDPTNPDGLSPNWIDAVVANEDGTYWIGTGLPDRGQKEGGLSLLDPASGKLVHFKYDPDDPTTISNNGIYDITRTRDGTLWIGTTRGLNVFHPETETFSRYYLGGDTLSKSLALSTEELNRPEAEHTWTDHVNIVVSINETSSGDLWLGTVGGLAHLERGTGALTYEVDDAPAAPMETQIASVLELQAGLFLLGGDGLRRYDARSDTWSSVSSRGELTLDMANLTITDMFQDRSGLIWISTFGDGLVSYDPETEHFRAYSEGDALPTDQVLCVEEDDFGFLWLSTFQGLVRLDPSTGATVHYGQSEGTLGTRFAGGACTKGRSGEILFGGEYGLTVVFPDRIATNPNRPRVVITSISVVDSLLRPGIDSRLPDGIAANAEFTLAHNDNSVSIEYTGLHFSDPGRLRYEYRLTPFDSKWRPVGSRRVASYTNLDPGSYDFRVRVWNDSVKSASDATIRFVILPPWWATWWAYLMYTIGLASIVYGGYELRVRTLRARADELSREVAERTRDLEKEKAKTEEQARRLLELDEAKNRFFANISHEFRTPLTLIVGPLQDALERVDDYDHDWLRRQLGLTMGNAKRLLRLINQLLDLSRLQSGKLELNPQPGDIAEYLRRLANSFVPAAERLGISLVFDTSHEELACLYDEDKVEKIVSNLLSNAMKFSPAGGKVLLGLDTVGETDDRFVEITVQDTGRGIPPEDLERIFDRFEQVDTTHRREFEGTGIGLALVRELTELHGGRINVESRLGFGSTFKVRLPFEEVGTTAARLRVPESSGDGKAADVLDHMPTSDRADVVQTESHVAASTSDESILIVENNADVREYLRSHLASDFHIIEAENGEEGLEAATTHRPSLILTDIMMPVMDGYELVRRIREDETTSHIPIVMLTAKADAGGAVTGIRAGADDYISKPFDASELKARVASLIDRRRAMRERFSEEIVVKGADIVITSDDAAFLQTITEIIDTHLGDTDFGGDWLADDVGLSRRQLERRLESILGESPAALIRRLRLERASQLLRARAGTVSEVAYSVGFASPAYFARAFRKAYGESPTEHMGDRSDHTSPDPTDRS